MIYNILISVVTIFTGTSLYFKLKVILPIINSALIRETKLMLKEALEKNIKEETDNIEYILKQKEIKEDNFIKTNKYNFIGIEDYKNSCYASYNKFNNFKCNDNNNKNLCVFNSNITKSRELVLNEKIENRKKLEIEKEEEYKQNIEQLKSHVKFELDKKELEKKLQEIKMTSTINTLSIQKSI